MTHAAALAATVDPVAVVSPTSPLPYAVAVLVALALTFPTVRRALVLPLLLVRRVLTFHRAGMARVAAADTAAARRRQREARRTVVDVDQAGRVTGVTRTRTR